MLDKKEENVGRDLIVSAKRVPLQAEEGVVERPGHQP